MTYELIICEKPNAANKIAFALADGKPIKENIAGVPFYKVTHGSKDIVVGCAVGHLYTLAEKNKKGWTYPIFDVEWVQSSAVNKEASYSSKYVTALKKLAKDASSLCVATDYDIEGEVIGFNVVKHICKKPDAKRMKFSTLTTDELRESYEHASPTLNWGQVNAGLTRHELDWYYGINLSRALSLSIKKAGSFKILSSGRVQGPALKIIVDREKEILAFKPEPFWQIMGIWSKNKANVEAWHKEDKFWEKEKAEKIMQNIKGEKKAKIESIEKAEFNQMPPVPFDLTTLQIESYRCFKIQPSETLNIAQELYLAGVISYPRTSSQQLPPEIGYKKILNKLSGNSNYKKFTDQLLSKLLKPYNGKKTDPAHPAIFPTGNFVELDGRQLKVFDLIVKRFLATFAEPAVRESVTIKLDIKAEIFISKGVRTIKKGWHDFYAPYVTLEEQELPHVEQKEIVDVKNIDMMEKETQPPKRYTAASIIKDLEKRNLGTKSTRAAVVDTLFHRGYITGQPMEATKLGIHTIETLEKYCESIIDEQLTKHFEDEMELIRENKKKNTDVLEEAKHVLTKILDKFKKNEKEIGQGLFGAFKDAEEAENTVGECPICHAGKLMIKRGRYGRFIACDKYPECKTTFNLPSTGKVKTSEKICELCNHPMIKIIQGRKAQEVCINLNCKSKTGKTETELKQLEKADKKCPKCGKAMILRKSVYGQFYGCSGYPNCKTIEKI
ncbi:DNA topoisomerase I [Candidatus Woesearchaeota archaeon]|nr:DNA topoisomerase I [Candidatus Woesearchaeota archaeon]